ncbi:MAG: hypothetical protein ACE5EY_03845, partial [Anaerolineae bacterium]
GRRPCTARRAAGARRATPSAPARRSACGGSLAAYSADNAMHSGKYFRSSDVSTAVYRPTLKVQMGIVDGFTMSLNKLSANIKTGETAVFRVNLQPLGSFTQPVTLTVTDPYAKLDVTPTQKTVSLPSTTKIRITDINGSGWYNFTVTAVGGSYQKTATISVFVADETIYLPVIQR